MAIGTGLVVSALRIHVSSARHRAWTAAMVGMLLLPVWTKWGPSVGAPVLPLLPELIVGVESPRPAAPLPAATWRVQAPQPAVAPPVPSAPRMPRPDWRQALSALYLAGLAVMLARLVRGAFQVRTLMSGARQTDGFAVSPLCATPVTIGWLRPALLLPESSNTWSAEKLDAVLIHEHEHVRRRDPLVQWLALLNRCIFWFHPLAWWLERKLAALAEESCDAAVLARGLAPLDYAVYLIEMARSVSEAGVRIQWAGAVNFSGGNLSDRIRRIVDEQPVKTMSRRQTAVAASLCLLTISTFLACSPQRPAARSDRPLQHALPRRQNDVALHGAAIRLTPAGAKELEADVQAHPEDSDKMAELVDYHRTKGDLAALDELTLWFIGNHPEMRTGWWQRPEWDTVWDKSGYDRGRRLWEEQLKKPWDSPWVYMNAAEFLSGAGSDADNEEAERVLREGQRRFPPAGAYSGLHWEVFLARHYAWALIGAHEQLPNRTYLFTLAAAAPTADGAYARKVRETLLASKDTELLVRATEQLQLNLTNREFCRALIERALTINPNDRFAQMRRHWQREEEVRLMVKTNPGSLSDADRLLWLQSQLEVLRFDGPQGVPWLTDPKDAEANARELLTLAGRNTNDPNYGAAVLLANSALGQVALRRGDKAEALKYLGQASEAPVTEYLRYGQIDLSLARGLLEAGDRAEVAAFLDRCASFNASSKDLARWAAEIRKGDNPKLMPAFNRFPKAG